MDIQKQTEYEPTPAELKLLEVLLDPGNRNRSKTEICQLADISRDTYYTAFKKPEFKELIRKTSKDLTIEYVLPTIHAFAQQARIGSFQHGEAILEMAGVYQKVMRQELTGKNGEPIEHNYNFAYLPDNELDKELSKYEKTKSPRKRKAAGTPKRKTNKAKS